jgi:hypothetical protein
MSDGHLEREGCQFILVLVQFTLMALMDLILTTHLGISQNQENHQGGSHLVLLPYRSSMDPTALE